MWILLIVEAIGLCGLGYLLNKAKAEARFYRIYKEMLQKLNTAYEKKYGKLSVDEELEAICPTSGLSEDIIAMRYMEKDNEYCYEIY